MYRNIHHQSPCAGCGDYHGAQEHCPATNRRCYKCGFYGHYSQSCRSDNEPRSRIHHNQIRMQHSSVNPAYQMRTQHSSVNPGYEIRTQHSNINPAFNRKCYKCRKYGHFSKSCTADESELNQATGSLERTDHNEPRKKLKLKQASVEPEKADVNLLEGVSKVIEENAKLKSANESLENENSQLKMQLEESCVLLDKSKKEVIKLKEEMKVQKAKYDKLQEES